MAVANPLQTVWTHVVSGEDRVALDSVFAIASISKPITACAIMQLVEQGKLLLHRPIATYLPEFGKNGKERVTTFHLLTHTSGLDESRWAASRFSGQPEIGPCFEEACNTSLSFEPGTKCRYGTLSFSVMGELITRLSGQPYPDYLREHLFAPLGMRDTGFDPSGTGRAVPVHNFGDTAQLARFIERAIPGGGMWSSAADLVAFGQALLRGGKREGHEILGPATIAAMTRLQVAEMTDWGDGNLVPFNYGLGWGKSAHVPGNIGSQHSYEHGGATGTLLWIDPDWDLIFVYLTNKWGDDSETARYALNAVYGSLTLEIPA
jgi:CubicO group peptidase (beta-lactamase class C family)